MKFFARRRVICCCFEVKLIHVNNLQAVYAVFSLHRHSIGT